MNDFDGMDFFEEEFASPKSGEYLNTVRNKFL